MMFFGAIQSCALSLVIHRDLSLWIVKGKAEIFSTLYAVRIEIAFSSNV